MAKVKIYSAGPWFTERQAAILDKVEGMLSSKKNISPYFPRKDGVKLPSNQKHDTELRFRVFRDNVTHIDEADFVLADLDAGDSYSDTGTLWEVGYAMARDIPVIGYDFSGKAKERYGSILNGLVDLLTDYEDLNTVLDTLSAEPTELEESTRARSKVLFVGAGNKEVDEKIATYISESGSSLRWVTNDHVNVYSRIDEIFDGVDYMIAVIDDRKPLVSWMIGQAYVRGIPVITYSDKDYGVNIMLLCALLTHLRGTSELVAFLQKVKREGLESIPRFDISTLNAI